MAGAVFLVAALALSPVIGGGFGEMTNAILQILVLVAVATVCCGPGGEGTGPVKPPGALWFGLFGAAFAGSVIGTEAVYFSLKQLLFMAACLGAYFTAAAVFRDHRAMAAAVWAAALSAMMVSVFGIRNYAISAGGGVHFWKALLGPGDHWRLFGPFINPGFFAGYLVITLPVTLAVYLITRRPALVLLAGLGFAVQVVALLLTGTKFGIVCASAGLLTFFLLTVVTRSLRRTKFGRLLIIAAIVLPLAVLFSRPVISRISAAEAGGSQVHSTEFRVYTWLATVNMIRAHPWAGVGPGVYEIAYPRYTIAGPTKYAHQSYLQIAAESGIPALLLFVAGLAAVFWRSAAALARPGRSSQSPPSRSSDEQASSGSVTWRDLVPFSARRVVGCSLLAALVGSALRSLVDSDWYLMGIALPFWVFAGILAAVSGTPQAAVEPGRRVKTLVGCTCALLMLSSLSFGLGDYYAGRVAAFGEHGGREVSLAALELYRRAVTVSPLNPNLRREYGRYLAHPLIGDDPRRGVREIDRAIAFAPTDASNYFARAQVALWTGSPRKAIPYLKETLKYNPKSTGTLLLLADTYGALGETAAQERTLRRLLEIESSPYEQIKGTPELVDTTFVRAHVYFGQKILSELGLLDTSGETVSLHESPDDDRTRQDRLARALSHFDAAIDRLERWRSNRQFLEVARYMGMLSKQEERALLVLLRDCYYRSADIREIMGNRAGARAARLKGDSVEIPDF